MSRRKHGRISWIAVSALLALWLSGCTTLQAARGGPGQRLDPWENWNRKVFSFNEDLDARVLRPVSTAYTKVVPQPVRNGIGNFFSNFADAWSAVNNMLQGKFEQGFQDVVRVGTNTLFGVFGFVDVATEMGLDHHYEDFGQTLGHWGVGAGAYVVLPLFGPSSVRDAVALPLDRSVSPSLIVNGGASQVGLITLQLVNTRASLLGASQVIDEISLDKYTFLRDAYLQRRRSLVFDGDAPDSSGGAQPPAESATGAAAAPDGAATLPAATSPAGSGAPTAAIRAPAPAARASAPTR